MADERSALREYLAFHQSSYFAVCYGLTDEQARSSPSASALSIGGLVKHVTRMQRSWMTRVATAPVAPSEDTRPPDTVAREFADQHAMRPDETLAALLGAFAEQNARSLRLVETADLDAPVPVPRDVPYFPQDHDAWSVRWVILHVINELARHAGHADIIRETLDGATMYELIAGLEGWAIDGWVTPWQKARQKG
ncbi:DinB family protein [Mycobacterium sherrisii]|uniref:DinB family protein n=1 Tax=Mycobacterium sherrisii TaxID=243061 RepID=A0A1E3T1A8_9MYCO|nr:DinB family protein [Mycobacterium sherrisii]MCV7028605.1 DinB family protein [Mycobacterium sherrisii]MEC4764540.1 DinB family protein [Mycobacterium sherrisii]ODR08151.1 hypothetical protein BHQ21_06940 [Mycobacterium sherrisii]ORW78906.1 hypothetical protein AWC25_05050 [Mycobacterium sherrisii]